MVGLVSSCAAEAPASDPTLAPSVTEAPTDRLSRYYGQQLAWKDCGGRAECTDLTVPIDYSNLDAGDMSIAVARYVAKDNTLGSLVYNPGGPGGSGVDFAKQAPYVVPEKVLDKYDFVSFDPRGVGESDPIECLSDKRTDKLLGANPAPDSPEEIAELTKDATRFGKVCARKSPKIVGFVDSGSVVKDMDVLRSALGEERLNFLGSSYGTKLGALYAQEFGPNVGRMVLDGVMPPDLTGDEIALGQAKGFDDALRQFVAWCQKEQSDCPVAGDDVDAGVAKVQAFLAGLADKPLKVGDREFTEGLGTQSILFLLYYPYNGDWELLARHLRSAMAGDAGPLLEVLNQRIQRNADGSYARNGNSYDSLVAVTCLDVPAQSAPEVLAERATEWQKEAPVFGAAMAWSGMVCTDWPVAAKPAIGPISAEDAGPVVLVGTKHDPATPYEWAQRLAETLADSRLITWDADGHTAYSNGSTCVDDAVNDYLVEGTLPPKDLVCE